MEKKEPGLKKIDYEGKKSVQHPKNEGK